MLKTFVLNSTNDIPYWCTQETQKMAPHQFFFLWFSYLLIYFNSFTAISWYLQGNSISAIKQQPILSHSALLKRQNLLRNVFAILLYFLCCYSLFWKSQILFLGQKPVKGSCSLPLSGSSSKVVLGMDVSVLMPEFSFLSLCNLRHHLEVWHLFSRLSLRTLHLFLSVQLTLPTTNKKSICTQTHITVH